MTLNDKHVFVHCNRPYPTQKFNLEGVLLKCFIPSTNMSIKVEIYSLAEHSNNKRDIKQDRKRGTYHSELFW